MEINKNAEYIISYPFIQDVYSKLTEDGALELKTWVPGCRNVFADPDDMALEADGIGEMILNVIDVHQPGSYPTRVFYTRKWRDPDGNVFGKGNLRIRVKWHFEKLLDGYYHPYSFSSKTCLVIGLFNE